MGRHDDLLNGAGVSEYSDPGYDWVDALVDTDPIELGRRTWRLAAALRDEIANGDRLAEALAIAVPEWTDWVEGKAALAAHRALRGLPDGAPAIEPWQRPTSSEVET